jgi:hypothetical protein
MSVLRVVDMWQMDHLCTVAIASLSKLWSESTAVQQLLHAVRYDVKEWYFPAVKHLALRDTTLSPQELSELGFDTAGKVLAIRDMHLKSYMASAEGLTGPRLKESSICEIENLFKCVRPTISLSTLASMLRSLGAKTP